MDDPVLRFVIAFAAVCTVWIGVVEGGRWLLSLPGAAVEAPCAIELDPGAAVPVSVRGCAGVDLVLEAESGAAGGRLAAEWRAAGPSR